jgi:hypothetical protein
MLPVLCSFLAAVMNHFYPSNAKDAKHNHAMILSDDVSDDVSIYDGTGSDEYHVELRGGTQCTQHIMSDDYFCNEVDATDYCFHWKGQDKVGKG